MQNTKKEITMVVAGVGGRGTGYSREVGKIGGTRIVGLAEPRHEYRDPVAQELDVPEQNLFDDWREMAEREKFADAVIIATQDKMHVEPVLAFAAKGYHILLEKPMAPNLEDCKAIINAVKQNNVILAVCHVLRHTNYTQKIKQIIESGAIGEIVSISHIEPVSFWHQAHSFVRGNWNNSKESSPMLLAKSCHDIDWIRYIMDRPCERVSSFGALSHFRRENQPTGAALRCLDCPASIESTCPYSAKRFYYTMLRENKLYWPLDILSANPTEESITEALRNGPYGRCVYACDNNVVDHQVVNMEFEGKRTASFTMTAFTASGGRKTNIFGTKGQIIGDSSNIEVWDFLTGECEKIDTNATDDNITGGHGGGDFKLLENFLTAIKSGSTEKILTGPAVSLESHLIVFASEISRHENRVVEMTDLFKN